MSDPSPVPNVSPSAEPVSAAHVFAKWYADEAQRREANRQLGERIFDALAAEDISSVMIVFDGVSDNGQVVQVSLRMRDKERPPSPEEIDFEGFTIGDAIEYYIYNRLSDDHKSWEVDAGSYGKFIMYVARREVDEQFTARIQDEDQYEEEQSVRVFV